MPVVKVCNRYLEKVTWLPSSQCDFNINGHATTWRVNINDNLAFLEYYASLMSADETMRANRYLQVRDKNRFIISRAALRLLLARYLNRQPAELIFEAGANKKPFIKNEVLQYNVSHSGDWIVIAIANTPVGVDIEWINPAFDYHDITGEYFGAEEAAYIAADKAHSRFFLLWTRKEALIKATAKGLDDDLKLIPALDGEHDMDTDILKSNVNWQSCSFELAPGYLATVTTTGADSRLRFFEANFPVGDH